MKVFRHPQIHQDWVQLLLVASSLFFLWSPVCFSGANEEWEAILLFDKGPGRQPVSRQDALELARDHFNRQLKALQTFILTNPHDPRVYDARLRQAGVLAAMGKMDNQPRFVEQAMAQLVALERDESLPPHLRADVAFRRISLSMQGAQTNLLHLRQSIANIVEDFARRFPSDKRAARLLVEAATLWDDQPNKKRDMLERALHLTQEEELKLRIKDDFLRLDKLGKPLDLKFSSIQGKEVDLQSLRGKVVAIVFWSASSPQSLLWLKNFRSVAVNIPPSQFAVLTLSLDTEIKPVRQVLQEMHVDWPTYFDGKGWENAIARAYGINALPTLWLVDKQGILRTINASANYETWIRRLTHGS